MTNRTIRTVALVVWAAVLLVAAVVPVGESVHTTMGPLGIVGLDAWLHASGYLVLVLAGAWALPATSVRTSAAVVLVAVVYGAGLEGVQMLVPYRFASPGDLLANAAGALAGGALSAGALSSGVVWRLRSWRDDEL